MGRLHRDRGRLDEARRGFDEAVETAQRTLGTEHPYTLIFAGYLGGVLAEQGKYDEAIALLAPIEPAARKTFAGSVEIRLATLLAALGSARAGMAFDADGFAPAEPNLVEAYAIFKDTRGPTHKETRECAQALVDLYTAWHAVEPNAGHDGKSDEWRARLANTDSASEALATVGG
jgi:tetratricopeptide (TPR) repeat protein